jgi:hypothetical protein
MQISPTYTYTQTGHYTVTLTAHNDEGCADIAQAVIAVHRPVFMPLVMRAA